MDLARLCLPNISTIHWPLNWAGVPVIPFMHTGFVTIFPVKFKALDVPVVLEGSGFTEMMSAKCDLFQKTGQTKRRVRMIGGIVEE